MTTDQAEGLRRRMAAPLSGLCTVLSADADGDKPALMRRLAASMMRRGRAVILIDAHDGDEGLAPTLAEVADGDASLAEASVLQPEGFQRMRLGRGRTEAALSQLVAQIAAHNARVLVDASFDAFGRLPLPLLADGELVVQLCGDADSIRRAYETLRAIKDLGGRGSVSLLVTGDDAVRAERARANLFHAASRYLALPVRSIVPQERSHV